MVFESVVAEILNKFLGDYVENLDRSQLKIGIWGGDVALKNLTLKPSALDDLNLPVKTTYGHLGKLILKIPWKNIYTAPVEVSVEDLFLLVSPLRDVVYNPEREEKLRQETKQALINKVELAKKTEKEKDGAKVDDTFVEKLAAQIIKNVQVFIQNIHVRYEDRITKPEYPFSIGMSLHTLKLHTTNETCDRYTLPAETSPVFYKIMVTESLSVYWNTNSSLFTGCENDDEKMIELFRNSISSKSNLISENLYILGPINAESKLQFNSKPEVMNFVTPKMFLSLVLEQLCIHLNRSQYQDLISLVETFDRMSRGAIYCKYRPKLHQYRGHYKEWWKFAITCILEENVRRKHNNWNWNLMSKHRQLCKSYEVAYRAKLTQKPTESIINEVNRLEWELDAFNIILLRQKVENEVEREGRIIAIEKASKKGWFGGWFSGSKVETEDSNGSEKEDLVKKFENAMTDEEKQKLYRAIDYHESAVPTTYPSSFVAIRLEFILRILKIEVIDDYLPSERKYISVKNLSAAPSVLRIEFKEAFVALQQRPAAQSVAISVKMQSFQILGLPQKNIVPCIIKSKLTSMGDDSQEFLNMYFETNPEEENYDQTFRITLRPLRIVYDAQTVIRILEVFTPEKDISNVKDQLQAAANVKLEEMKEKSALRFQYAIEKSIRLDLKVDLMAPYLIIPFDGFYTKNELALVINLGRITIESKSRGDADYNVKKMILDGRSKDEVLSQMMSECYDRFSVCLGDVQVLVLRAGESWRPMFEPADSMYDNHILRPTSVYVDLYRCLIDNDPRLPKFKVDGSLPDITLRITEKKLLEIVSLILSLPLPQKPSSTITEIEPVVKDDLGSLYDSATSLRQRLESFNRMHFSTLKKYRRTVDTASDDEIDNEGDIGTVSDFFNLEANFTWKALTLFVENNSDSPMIEAAVSGLELKFIQRMYSCEIVVRLGNISLTQNYKSSVVPTISTPISSDQEQYLFSCKLLMAEKDSPVFEKLYNSTAISVEVDFTQLYVLAHQEAILSTIEWFNNLQSHILSLISTHQNKNPQDSKFKQNLQKPRKVSVSSNTSGFVSRRKKFKTKTALTAVIEDHLSDMSDKRVKKPISDVTELKFTATLGIIRVCLQTAYRPLATMDVDGFSASVSVKKLNTHINVVLQSVSIGDLNPDTMYNKVAHIAEGKDALQVQMVVNNEGSAADLHDDSFDVFVKLQMNCVQCVFMNEFVMDVLEFMNNFQTSKQLLADASAAAVASAKSNVQQVYQSSTRVSLDIYADAPVIIVPRNNQSEEIFIIDFGNLSVKNALKKLPADSSNHAPIIDEIFTNLQDMKVVRTNYGKNTAEHLILPPVNYTLVIKRNISTSWYTKAPDFDINGVFCPIQIFVTDQDYKLLMKTLNENISTPQRKTPMPGDKSKKSIRTASKVEQLVTAEETVESEVVIEYEDVDMEKVRIFIRFSMAIESITIDLFSGSINEYEENSLAKFSLSFLCVKGSVLTNNDVSVHAFLSDCCIDDTRSSKKANKVKRYMKRKTSDQVSTADLSSQWLSTVVTKDDCSDFETSVNIPSDNFSRSMIDVTYEKKASHTHINARVFSFVLIFNVDHLTKIQEFFMSESTADSSAFSSIDANKKTNTISLVESTKVESLETSSSVTSCSIIIEKPDIILVENLDDIDTNAIILNNEANLIVQLNDDGHLAINGILKNLQLYSCCYNPAKRSQTTALILHPLNVVLAGSTHDGKNLNLDLNISDVMFSITAGTIELLSKISTTLIPTAESEDCGNEVILKDYSNIWQQSPVREDYWFLQTVQEGVDIVACEPLADVANVNDSGPKRLDKIIIKAPCIEITLEAGVGKKTLPLLAMQSSFQGTITKSTELLLLESYISLEVGYYNSRLALWEPVIEPLLEQQSVDSNIKPVYVPWKMQFNVQMVNKEAETIKNALDNPDTSIMSAGSRSLSNAESLQEQPTLGVYIKSLERMELTFTKTCLDVVKNLTQSFNNAVYLKSSSSLSTLNEAGYSSYVLVNDLGVDVILTLHSDGLFRLLKGDLNESVVNNISESITIKTGHTVNLIMKKERTQESMNGNVIKSCLLEKLNTVTNQQSYALHLHIPSKNKDLILPVSRADKRYFSLRNQDSIKNDNVSSDFWGLVSEVDIVDGSIVTTLRSIVRIFNHFTVEIQIFYLKTENNKNEVVEIGKVGPSQHLNLPVQAVYTTKSHLYFAPAKYSMCNEPFIWKDLMKSVSLSQQVQCISKNSENEDPFFIRILGEMEQIYFENTSSYTMASTVYNIHLRPTLIFKNFLSIDIVCCLQGVATEYVLKPGQRINVSTAEPDHSTIIIRLDNYLDKVWSCKKIIKSDAPTFSVWTFTSYDSEKSFSLNLGLWYSSCADSMIFALYCPFWMVNKTGLSLSYKGVEDDGMILHHPRDFDEPILFSFKEKSFFSKKKACVRINDGDWSDKLSIDAAGSSGLVVCPYKNQLFQLGVYIRLNSNSLTKQVIFSPFYTVANNCPFVVEFREDKAKNVIWNVISPGACIPFWPTVQDEKDKTLEIRINGTNEITPSFSYLRIRTYPLILLNKFGGIVADVQVTEGGVYIAISPFQPRMAPALIINNTETSVEFTEVDLRIKSLENIKERENAVARCLQNDNLRSWQLGAKKEILFNWSSVNSQKPVLLVNKNPCPVDLRQDGIGEFSSNENDEKKYWISFLNGMQRILLITTDEYILKEIEAIGDFEQIQQEIALSLEGIGFSLVNNVFKKELLYISISSTGVVWETQKKLGKRFKPVSSALNEKLEKAYLNYCNMLKTTDSLLDIDQEIELGRQTVVVNFSKGIITQPVKENLRRTYNSGLWIQVRSSERYKQIHAKVHRLQMDNQIYDCVFPVIFVPVPPPKSVAASSDDFNNEQEKPFAELSIVERLNQGSIRQFKYFKVLIQEFHVKVDVGFVNELVKFFEADNITDEEEITQFENDEKVIKEALGVHVTSVTSQDFYDLLHFSPLKIHISFSLAGENSNDGTPQQGLPIVNLITQSVGVTLTDVQDVVFRLAYFERKHKFYSQAQLRAEAQTHYIGQFVKQLYVLVLGLDVLGNPFGLVTGLKQGVEDFFYEPFQGAIQGPSEFAEGVILGVRSLFGHTVGGAAGAVGRITGAMGKGIAALTLDEDYQRKRRQRLAQHQQSFAEGGRGLVMGVVEGVGGVISKPISGAREEGVGGFIKGVGKGMVGLFMRPASGVVDFASGTVDVVRRVATCSEEIRRYRLPRFIKENGLVIPYTNKDAQGFKYLLDIEKGKFVETDTYLFHIYMASDREILLITNNRVAYLVKATDIFSDSIRLDWQYTWREIKLDDGIGETENGIYIKPEIDNRRSTTFGISGSIFRKPNKGKILIIPNEQTRQWLVKEMNDLVRKAHRF